MAEQLLVKVGFLGFGNMGGAILYGLLESGTLAPRQAIVCDKDESKNGAACRLGAELADSPGDLARECDVLLLAVKPQDMEATLAELAQNGAARPLIISVAAGVSVDFVRERLGAEARVIRAMPNTPALVRAGATGLAPGPGCGDDELRIARTIFEAVGIVEIVEEPLMDAVTALSGSGPAYFFYMVECMAAAAEKQGLSKPQAARLAAQTLYGAGCLLTKSGESARVLRERVTSKGGTTEAALACLREQGLDELADAAVASAVSRSRELGS